MRAAVILADDRVPQRLAWTAHAHRQRQQAQHRRLLGIVRDQLLVAAHARVVIDVAGLGHADAWMNQQVRLGDLRSAERQFEVRAMHRVARLERHDALPAEFFEMRPCLARRHAQMTEVVVARRFEAAQLAAEINRIGLVEQVVDAGMQAIGRSENRLRLVLAIGFPRVGDVENRENHAFRVAQRNALARSEFFGEFARDVERDRHRPHDAGNQAHLAADPVVIGARHETVERRERAAQQQFQITQLARRQIPRGKLRGLALERDTLGGWDRDQVDELAAMRRDQL